MRSGRVSKPPSGYRIYFCGEINESTTDEQTKNNSSFSLGMASPAVCENSAPPDNLSRLLTALAGPNQLKIHSFVSTPKTSITTVSNGSRENADGHFK